MLEGLNDWIADFWYFNREVLVMGAITIFIGGQIWRLGELSIDALIQQIKRVRNAQKDGN